MHIPLDPETRVVEQHFAVVYAPMRRDAQVPRKAGSREWPRRQRDRFPETCVQTVDSEALARSAADPAGKRFAAIVVGPSRSSEGAMLYYLVQWLDEA